MIYEEVLICKAREKLSDWKIIEDECRSMWWKGDSYGEGPFLEFFVWGTNTTALESGFISVRYSDRLVGTCWANNLENFFEDPFNATLEEASLFRLEFGFDYPEELVNDL